MTKSSLLQFVVGVAGALVLGALAGTRDASRGSEDVAATWSASLTERRTWIGIQTNYRKIDEAVAAVITDDRPSVNAKGEVVQSGLRTRMIQGIYSAMKDHDEAVEQFLAEVRARGRVNPKARLVLVDGVSWVETR